MNPPRTDRRYAQARYALAPYRILNTPPEPAFDVFTGLVRAALGVPAALLAFFDGETMAVKASAGSPERHAGVAAGLRDVFEFEHTIVRSDGAGLFCGAPIATPDGQTVGAIAGLAFDERPAAPSFHATMAAIAEAVTQALEGRRQTDPAAVAASRRLVAFDAADLSVVFADAATTHAHGVPHAEIQTRAFDDIFNGIDPDARHAIDLLRDLLDGEPITFLASALGPLGFWSPVACTARVIRDRRMRALLVVEFGPRAAPVRSNLHMLPPLAASAHDHCIDAVLSKIEAGRRALRGEREIGGTARTLEGFLRDARQVLAENTTAPLLVVFRAEPHAVHDSVERARRARLVCDHDLVAILDEMHVAVLLRDAPIAIGRQAVKRFARSQPGLRFAVRDACRADAGLRELLVDAVAELRHH